MKRIVIGLLLLASQAHAGELLMDCYFGNKMKTFSLKELDVQDGACHVGNYYNNEGMVRIRYLVELCDMDARGKVFTGFGNSHRWDEVGTFSTEKECQLRRKIEIVRRGPSEFSL